MIWYVQRQEDICDRREGCPGRAFWWRLLSYTSSAGNWSYSMEDNLVMDDILPTTKEAQANQRLRSLFSRLGSNSGCCRIFKTAGCSRNCCSISLKTFVRYSSLTVKPSSSLSSLSGLIEPKIKIRHWERFKLTSVCPKHPTLPSHWTPSRNSVWMATDPAAVPLIPPDDL